MEKNKKSKKVIILTIIIIIETIILVLSLLYSSAIFLFKDNKTEWFDEISPDGKYHVKCFKVGEALLFSSQKILVYFDTTGLPYVLGTNPLSFNTEIANDGANLNDDNYAIEWLDDSVKIVFKGKEMGEHIYQIPYYKNNSEN